MEMELFTMTEAEKQEAIKAFREKVKSIPPESERKEKLFNSLKAILEAMGSYINDDIEFKRETVGDKEYIIYKSVYGTVKQDITGDSIKALFEDALTLLLGNCREMQGSFNVLQKRLGKEEE